MPRLSRLPRVAAGALSAVLAAFIACSSSSSNPPQLGTCVSTPSLPCLGAVPGGGMSPQPEGGGPSDSGTVIVGEGGACTGASQIFSSAAPSCATCVAASCCGNTTSCPNDPSCVSIAVCVAQTCLQNDSSCLPTCEGASQPGTVTEYIDFQQCVGANCPGCPVVSAADF